MSKPFRVAVVIGSTREGRLAPTISRWLIEHTSRREEFVMDIMDLAEVSLPAVMSKGAGAEVAALNARLGAADAYVVLTPEYNHSFPAPLKAAIDWSSRAWKAKPVAFVAYGGRAGGLRAVEQLRQVFAEMHAVTIRDTVSFHDAWSVFDSAGHPAGAEAAESALRTMLDQLAWWAHALREARTANPYSF